MNRISPTTEASATIPADAELAGVLPYTRLDQRTLLGHPPGLFLLFGVEMWERFSFYGMKAILAFYLAGKLVGDNPGRGWSKGEASILVGWYAGMCYLLPIVGGLIADKLIGTHRSMVLGGCMIALGHIALAFSGLGTLATSAAGLGVFVAGLALIVLGTGHFKPSVSVMVGQLYDEKDPRRDNAFSIFYMGINVGALLGTFFCGLLGEKVGWHWGFGAAAVGMIAGLIMYTIGRPTYLRGVGLPPESAPQVFPLLWLVVPVLAGLFGFGYHAGWLNRVADVVAVVFAQNTQGYIFQGALAAVVLALVIWFVMIQKAGERGATACIFIFMAFNVFFWFAFEQSETSLNFFAQERTDRMLFGWEFPASWFLNVNPFFIILLTPVFASMWSALAARRTDMSMSIKIALGLFWLGLGYVLMVFAGHIASGPGAKAGIFWLMGAYLLFTIGELFLSPTGLAFVTQRAPVRFVSLLMGVWFISSFLAHLIGGYVAATVEAIEAGTVKLPWDGWGIGGQGNFFMLFVLSSMSAALLVFVLTPLFNRMLARPAGPPQRGFPVGETERAQ